MQKIVPHLWFNTEAVSAGRFYAETFPDSRVLREQRLANTPSGDVDLVVVSLCGFQMQFLSAGPSFKINPSLSFRVNCTTAGEVESLHRVLIEGGQALMELGEYPFSARYAWVVDRFGVSWQLMLVEGPVTHKIIPTQMFIGAKAGRAEEAATLYAGLFGGQIDVLSRYGAGMEPNTPDMLSQAVVRLGGQSFALLDSAYEHLFDFNEAVSYLVTCDDQAEIDRYWNALSAVPEAEACGWLKDRFGFSWQIVPAVLGELMGQGGEAAGRVTAAFLKMKKLDIEALEKAATGPPSPTRS